MRSKNLKKISLTALISLEVFMMSFSSVLAQSMSSSPSMPGSGVKGSTLLGSSGGSVYPSPSEVAAEIEQRYHLDPISMQNAGETFNVASQKTDAPQVTIVFNPASPKPGEKITANAVPMYFGNANMKALYYTWYINHRGDLKIVPNEWKIEASRIIAGNGFDWKRAMGKGNYDYDKLLPKDQRTCDVDSPPDFCSADNKYKFSTVSSADSDGYRAFFGGDDQQKNKLGGNVMDDMGKYADLITCIASVTEENDAGTDTDKATPIKDLITSKLISRIIATCNSQIADALKLDDGQVLSWVTQIVHTIRDNTNWQDVFTLDLQEPYLHINAAGLGAFRDKVVKAVREVIEKEAEKLYNQMPKCYIHDFGTGTNYEMVRKNTSGWISGCGHQFPVIVNANDYGKLCTVLSSYWNLGSLCEKLNGASDWQNIGLVGIGNNNYDKLEEFFFRTNPDDPSTADNGNKDEANVAGLGQDSFTWTYQAGDKVGVIVEGVGITPTKYEDSSKMIMWAYPKNDCKVPEDKIGEKSIIVKGYPVKIPTVEMTQKDINDCLIKNLVDPTEGGQSAKVDVNLSYTPDSPINDSTDYKGDYLQSEGDELIINSTVSNVKDKNFLKYNWEINYLDSEGNISGAETGKPLTKAQIPGLKQTSGFGLDSIRFPLNFPDYKGNFYLKVHLTVRENIFKGVANEGNADVFILVSSTGGKIKVFPTAVDASGNISLVDGTGNGLCADRTQVEGVVCPVMKNQIVGLKVDETKNKMTDMAWTLDGKPLPCLEGTNCSGNSENTNIAYFPVLKNTGEQYSVSLIANNADGEKVNLTRTFEVTDPQVSLACADESKASCHPEQLGTFVGIDGTKYPDESTDSFEVEADKSVTLKANVNMPIQNLYQASWSFDGMTIPVGDSDIAKALQSYAEQTLGVKLGVDEKTQAPTLIFNTDKAINDSYAISFGGIYSQDNNTKQFLANNWNVDFNQFYEKPIGSEIEAKVIAAPATDVGIKAQSQKILATLFTGFPVYFAFLFRIFLTTLLILFTSWLVMSFTEYSNERY
ncbi:MAG: hypothetical protein NTZ97_02760 [Candidatus Moranbacteria bacterium]|nr:hypothetical protein [Candidatus Moranbacteria bacterium]